MNLSSPGILAFALAVAVGGNPMTSQATTPTTPAKPAPAKPAKPEAPKPTPAPEPKVETTIDAGLSAALDDLDFDD